MIDPKRQCSYDSYDFWCHNSVVLALYFVQESRPNSASNHGLDQAAFGVPSIPQNIGGKHVRALASRSEKYNSTRHTLAIKQVVAKVPRNLWTQMLSPTLVLEAY